ncbi:hypothetical protein AB0D14_15415 [Streptomyces sp. NPDC048484]|uniref:hypothetical protein n=1 Tax=Streptomyces sp. NPDC048484 TaxID=3155146 RepID=UPI003443E891
MFFVKDVHKIIRKRSSLGPSGGFVIFRRFSPACVVAAAVLLVGATAATAAADPSNTVSVATTDGNPIGGTGIFWGDFDHGADNPEVLGACDKQSDGLRVYANVSWQDSNGNWDIREVEDATGMGDGCEYKYLPNIADGTKVYIDACLKNGANGAVRFCGSGTAIA